MFFEAWFKFLSAFILCFDRILVLNHLNHWTTQCNFCFMFCVFSVLSPEKVSRMEHVLPVWTTSWSSKSAKQIHMQVHLGVRVSSLNHSELWVLKSIHLINFTWRFLYSSGFLLDYISKERSLGFLFPLGLYVVQRAAMCCLHFCNNFFCEGTSIVWSHL